MSSMYDTYAKDFKIQVTIKGVNYYVTVRALNWQEAEQLAQQMYGPEARCTVCF